MDLKQNPFSFYDFLGYFTPGALATYLIFFAYGHYSAPADTSIAAILKSSLTFSDSDKELYIPFILFSYCIGHVLNFLSSITVEKFSVWTLGYPSKFLLEGKYPKFLKKENDKEENSKEVSWREKIIRGSIWLFLLPVSILDWLLGNLLGARVLYAKDLDDYLYKHVAYKVGLLLSRSGVVGQVEASVVVKSDHFRYVYHYALENAPAHVPKMQNYVALYGFLRTLTLLSICMFWMLFCHMVVTLITQGFSFKIFTLLALISGLAYVFYMGFVKFYRRFTLEAFMAITVICPEDNQK